MRTLAGGVLDTAIFMELQLPLTPIADKNPTLGLGQTSAKDIAAAAFLASGEQTNKLCERLLPHAINDLAAYPDAKAAFNLWNFSFRPLDRLPFSAPKAPHRRKRLTDTVHMALQKELPQGDTRRRAFRASMKVACAKGWVHCVPSVGLKTAISTRNFSVSFWYYCQVPSSAPGTP